jgi:outer membrane PBP1 activator LpoA protein
MWLAMLFKRLYMQLGIFFFVLFITSCASQIKVEDPALLRQNQLAQNAQQLLAEGKYWEAATLYRQLAEQPSMQQNIFRLQAAEVLLKIEDAVAAKAYADLVAPANLTEVWRNRLYLLYAQIYLNAGNAEQAVSRLNLISVLLLSAQQKHLYHETAAFAYALTGELITSVHERIALDRFLNARQKRDNSIAILDTLSLLPLTILQTQLDVSTGGVYSGWLEIAIMTHQMPLGSAEFDRAINAWQQLYIRHPANSLINSDYFILSRIELGNVSNIAVFLPESGSYSRYAAAVKAGFMAAYYHYEKNALRPNIRFYDTSQSIGIVALYHQAIAEGAQLVIGPLQKSLINELAVVDNLTVPILALNYVDNLAKKNLYQFALSPIDEVQQVVNQAWFAGYKNALILRPDTENGERLEKYFYNAWTALDGNILAVEKFVPRSKDFSEPVRHMLNVNESQYRLKALTNVVGGVENNPRRRQDIDVIFMVANRQEARLINPQFYHNRAARISIYSLSRIYSGKMDIIKNVDLEGVSFCGIPWLLEGAYQGELNLAALQNTWEQFPESFLSLIAFGIDAFTIVPHLDKLQAVQFHGATGNLLLNGSNRIERQLVCAQFNQGKVQLIETMQDMAEGYEGIATQPISSQQEAVGAE